MTNWQDLTMPGLEALGQQTQTVILPLGSLEEHGPHLPLGTDTFHALEVARRVAKLRPVVVAPPLFYGMCRSTREHPGTVSISGDALRALLLVGGPGILPPGLAQPGVHQRPRRRHPHQRHRGGRRTSAGGAARGQDRGGQPAGDAPGGFERPTGPGPDPGRLPCRGGGDGHHDGGATPTWSGAPPRRNGPGFPSTCWCGIKDATGPGGCGATRPRPPRPRERRSWRPRQTD